MYDYGCTSIVMLNQLNQSNSAWVSAAVPGTAQALQVALSDSVPSALEVLQAPTLLAQLLLLCKRRWDWLQHPGFIPCKHRAGQTEPKIHGSSKAAWLRCVDVALVLCWRWRCVGVALALLYCTIIFMDAPGRYEVNDKYNLVVLKNGLLSSFCKGKLRHGGFPTCIFPRGPVACERHFPKQAVAKAAVPTGFYSVMGCADLPNWRGGVGPCSVSPRFAFPVHRSQGDGWSAPAATAADVKVRYRSVMLIQ